MVEKRVHRFIILFVGLFLLPCLWWTPYCQAGKSEVTVKRPTVFDSRGVINRIGSKEMVISDILYQVNSETAFYSEKNKKISSAYFAKGTEVGIMYKRGPMKVISEVWKIKPGE